MCEYVRMDGSKITVKYSDMIRRNGNSYNTVLTSEKLIEVHTCAVEIQFLLDMTTSIQIERHELHVHVP